MARVAKRKVDESWADAVARLAASKGMTAVCVAAFDTRVSAGCKEYEAAYLALRDFDCLHRVDLPGDPQQPLNDAESDQIEPPGS